MLLSLLIRLLTGKKVIYVSKWWFIKLPAFVDYDDDSVPEPFGAVAQKYQVYIKEKYRNDEGLLQHELTHVKQYWENEDHCDRYDTDLDYRLRCELEAYREQIKYGPGNVEWFAEFLATRYSLNITKEEAKRLLM